MLRELSHALIRALPVVALVLSVGCTSTGVGDPCTPEAIPSNGFQRREVYLETNSVQCRTRVCMVYGLQGNPEHVDGQPPCNSATPPTDCVTQAAVDNRVYCTCRCDAPAGSNTPTCQCPGGYECREVQTIGGPGIVGSYCVKSDVQLDGPQ